MQNPRFFGHSQNFVWQGKIVDLTFADTLKEPCAASVSSTGSKGLNGRCIKGSATIFANGVN